MNCGFTNSFHEVIFIVPTIKQTWTSRAMNSCVCIFRHCTFEVILVRSVRTTLQVISESVWKKRTCTKIEQTITDPVAHIMPSIINMLSNAEILTCPSAWLSQRSTLWQNTRNTHIRSKRLARHAGPPERANRQMRSGLLLQVHSCNKNSTDDGY